MFNKIRHSFLPFNQQPMCEQGFIKLSRKYFCNFLWNEPREYSKAEAWLDLIGSARFEASTELINGRVIELRRGEMPASRRFLESRWKWGSTKVKNFLALLLKKGMVTQRQSHGQTILFLCKYDFYNGSNTTDKPCNKPEPARWQPGNEPAVNQNREYKKKRSKEYYNLLPPEQESNIHKNASYSQNTAGFYPEKEKDCAPKEERYTIPPSLEMVAGYCRERGSRISPETFVNFYAAKGWMIGKNRMKDWQAAIRTWEENVQSPKAPAAKTSKFAQIRKNVERNLIHGNEPSD